MFLIFQPWFSLAANPGEIPDRHSEVQNLPDTGSCFNRLFKERHIAGYGYLTFVIPNVILINVFITFVKNGGVLDSTGVKRLQRRVELSATRKYRGN